MPPLVYSSFHRSLNTGHGGEQPVYMQDQWALGGLPGQIPRPSRVLRPQLTEGR